jgi:hypothetical protein
VNILALVPSRARPIGLSVSDYLGYPLADEARGQEITSAYRRYQQQYPNENYYQAQYNRVSINGCCGAGFLLKPHLYLNQHSPNNQGILTLLNPKPEEVQEIAEKRNYSVVELVFGEDKLVYLFAKEES